MRLKELQAKWYGKLRESGFDDIESRSGALRGMTDYKHGQFEFYRKAGWFLHDHTFQSDEEKLLWSFFCEGMTQREIAIRLGVCQKTICNRLNRIIRGPFKAYMEKQAEIYYL